jgi:hypothetical protein
MTNTTLPHTWSLALGATLVLLALAPLGQLAARIVGG